MEIRLLFKKSFYKLVFYFLLTMSPEISNMSQCGCFELILTSKLFLFSCQTDPNAWKTLFFEFLVPATVFDLGDFVCQIWSKIIDWRVLGLLLFFRLDFLILEFPVMLNALDCFVDVFFCEHFSEGLEPVFYALSAVFAVFQAGIFTHGWHIGLKVLHEGLGWRSIVGALGETISGLLPSWSHRLDLLRSCVAFLPIFIHNVVCFKWASIYLLFRLEYIF